MTDPYDTHVDALIDDAARNGFGGEPEPTDDDRPWPPYPEYARGEYERLVIAEAEREGGEGQ